MQHSYILWGSLRIPYLIYFRNTGIYIYIPIVSGDANFHMKKTALTVGGFTQPNVAKSLLESPQATEKGLVQRFLWLFPKPSYSDFSSLQKANQEFVEYLGMFCKPLSMYVFLTFFTDLSLCQYYIATFMAILTV